MGLRSACVPDGPMNKLSMMYQPRSNEANWTHMPTPLTQDLAAFLLLRGPYAWIGYNWVGCVGSPPLDRGKRPQDIEYPRAFAFDYGTPWGTCKETGVDTKVFTRKWTNAHVTLDCHDFTAKITHPGG